MLSLSVILSHPSLREMSTLPKSAWLAGKAQRVSIRKSPSYIYNNLTSCGEHIAFIHGNEVYVLSDRMQDEVGSVVPTRLPSHTVTVHAILYGQLHGTYYLAVGTTAGAQVWDAAGKQLLVEHRGLQPKEANPSPAQQDEGCRAICFHPSTDSKQSSTISFVSTLGRWLPVSVAVESKDKGSWHIPETWQQLPLLSATAATAPSPGNLLVVSDEAGTIHFIDCSSGQTLQTWTELLIPVTSMVSMRWMDCVAIALLNGEIVILGVQYQEGSTLTLIKRASVSAHARVVTALSVHPTLPVICSASDDCRAGVWQVEPTKDAQGQTICHIQTLGHFKVENRICVGASFAEPDFGHFVIACFDTEKLRVIAPA
jgi:hypothetical protein